VSCAPEDRGRVERLGYALIESGWSVWLDSAGPDQSLADAEEVRPEVIGAKCVLVLWSSSALRSRWVSGHARQAIERNTFISAFIGAVNLPQEFARFETLDLSKWDGDPNADEFKHLSQMVATLTSGKRTDSELPSQASVQGPALFLCYRREDTQDAAGRLHDRLADAYESDRVFMDIDSVPLGIDFVEHVSEQLAECAAVIVMIGRQWLAITDKRGRRRLDLADDLVRVEIASALARKIPVVPVLVQGAEVPSAEELPDVIRPLSRRNGIDLSGAAWKSGVERLIKELDRVMKG
jgi:TIR domain